MKRFAGIAGLIASAFMLAVLAGCSDGSSTSGGSNGNGSSRMVLDISDATNLYIGKSSSVLSAGSRSASVSDTNRLFKITEDGYAEEVSYTYEDGSTVTESLEPSSLLSLNSDYIIVCFNYDSYKYLVNTTTGYCYEYDAEVPYIYDVGYYEGDAIQNDGYGNIYMVINSRISMLNVSAPDNVTLKALSPSTESIGTYRWAVDKDGNIAYKGNDSSYNEVRRFRSAAGGYSNLSGETNYSTLFWQGLDGLIYYFNASNISSSDDYYTSGIKKLYSSPSFTEEALALKKEANSYYYYTFSGMSRSLLKAKNKNRTILLDYYNPAFYEVYNPETNTVKVIEAQTVGLKTFKLGTSSDDYYYLAGTDTNSKQTIVKIEPSDYSYEYLLSDSNYDIYAISLNDAEEVIFNALRMSDGAVVMGKIGTDKTVSILDENLDEQVTVLQRIR